MHSTGINRTGLLGGEHRISQRPSSPAHGISSHSCRSIGYHEWRAVSAGEQAVGLNVAGE